MINNASKVVPGDLSDKQILNLGKLDANIQLFVMELPERYREFVGLYDRAKAVGVYGYYPILQHEACFKMARFLMHIQHSAFVPMFTNGSSIPIWTYEQKGIGADIVAAARFVGDKTVNKTDLAPMDEILQLPGASRIDILSWAMRAWQTGSEFLNTKDQLSSLSIICSICSQLRFHRKHAFFLRLTGLTTQVLSQKHPGEVKHPSPAIQCMLKSFEILNGALEKRQNVEPWMNEFDNASDIDGNSIKNLSHASAQIGWPFLQVHILRECIEMAEVQRDLLSQILIT